MKRIKYAISDWFNEKTWYYTKSGWVIASIPPVDTIWFFDRFGAEIVAQGQGGLVERFEEEVPSF